MKIKRILFILVICAIAIPLFSIPVTYTNCINEIANKLSFDLTNSQPVAFTSFDSNSDSFTTRFISDIEGALTNRGLLVLDRSNTQAIIKELEFQTSGLVDDKQAVSIGHMLGARFIITGSAKNMISYYRVDLKLIDLETTLVKQQLSFDIEYDNTLKNILNENSDSIGSQKIGVEVKLNYSIQFNKAHPDMISGIITPEEKSLKPLVFSVGVFYCLNNDTKILAEIDYFSKNGMIISNTGTVQYSSLDIPLILKYSFIQKPIIAEIYAGLYASFPITKMTIITPSLYEGTLVIKNKSFGALAGCTVNLPFGVGKIILDARYFYDFSPIKLEVPDSIIQNSFQRKGINISIGYDLSLF